MMKLNKAALLLSAAMAASGTAHAASPSSEELQKTVEDLRRQVEALDRKINDGARVQGAQVSAGPTSTVKFGGYGEMHYNNLSADDSANDVEEIDFHRFVLFVGYDFSESIRFVSEVELEHVIASAEDEGEVELEQAFIEFDVNPTWRARGGLMLLPIGILNETHEPPTFYGVERNDVENIIVPTTWWAGGASVMGSWSNGLSWDLMVHEGLMVPTDGDDAFRVRSGRQETSEAAASDLAVTSRLSYSGLPGFKLAAAVNYQSDASQENNDGLEEALLYTLNMQYTQGMVGIRALYGEWDISGDAVEAAGDDDQSGWYVEPSIKPWQKVGFYARYEDVEGARDQDQFDQWEGGVNFWPHPQVVLKADYRSRQHDLPVEEGRDFDGFDLGIGYQF